MVTMETGWHVWLLTSLPRDPRFHYFSVLMITFVLSQCLACSAAEKESMQSTPSPISAFEDGE